MLNNIIFPINILFKAVHNLISFLITPQVINSYPYDVPTSFKDAFAIRDEAYSSYIWVFFSSKDVLLVNHIIKEVVVFNLLNLSTNQEVIIKDSSYFPNFIGDLVIKACAEVEGLILIINWAVIIFIIVNSKVLIISIFLIIFFFPILSFINIQKQKIFLVYFPSKCQKVFHFLQKVIFWLGRLVQKAIKRVF